eukprot:scaffold1182_cov124-Isochrysis_galbana.AAC.7
MPPCTRTRHRPRADGAAGAGGWGAPCVGARTVVSAKSCAEGKEASEPGSSGRPEPRQSSRRPASPPAGGNCRSSPAMMHWAARPTHPRDC